MIVSKRLFISNPIVCRGRPRFAGSRLNRHLATFLFEGALHGGFARDFCKGQAQ